MNERRQREMKIRRSTRCHGANWTCVLLVAISVCGGCDEKTPPVPETPPPSAVANPAEDQSNDGFRPPVLPKSIGPQSDESTDGFRPPFLPESMKSEPAEPLDGFVRSVPSHPDKVVPKPLRSQLDLEQINRKLALVNAIDELRKCKRLEFMDLNTNVKIVASDAVRDKLAAILSQRAVLIDPDEPDYKVAAEASFDAGEVDVSVYGPGTLEIRRGRQELAYCHGPEIDRLCEDLVAEGKARLKTADILRRFAN